MNIWVKVSKIMHANIDDEIIILVTAHGNSQDHYAANNCNLNFP